MTGRNTEVQVLQDRTALFSDAAERIVQAATDCIRERGRFTLALSGGATPNGVYTLLATKPFRSRVVWPQVHVFWGDERCVPPDDPRSNYRAAYELLLSHVPIPAANIHRMQGEIDPSMAAMQYESLLRSHFGTPSGAPRYASGANFDLMLLGVGADGHTASIFPEGTALQEQQRWALAEYAASAGTWRITVTLPVINAAARVLMLVAGGEKRAIMERVLSPHASQVLQNDASLPAERVQPAEGELTWLLDSAAMPALDPG
ncbi:MAG: 6-phosphogluconolactonase [Gemmatimonadota bacterium]